MAVKKWISKAISRPGALHRALGVPVGKRIPAGKIAAAAKKPGRLGKMARLARTLGGMRRPSVATRKRAGRKAAATRKRRGG